MINLINTDNIITIELHDESIHDCYSHKSKSSILDFINPLGFYYKGKYIGKYIQSLHLHNKNVIYKHGKIYNKPYVLVHTTADSNSWKRYYFDNMNALYHFTSRILFRNQNIIRVQN